MKRGKKVLCSILSLALLCALSLPARAAEPWRTLEGIAYYGDRSKCAMTEEQARAFVEVIDREMARTDWRDESYKLEMKYATSDIKGFAALFDLGNGIPALLFARMFETEMDGSLGESSIWLYQDGATIPFGPAKDNWSTTLYEKAIKVQDSESEIVYPYRNGEISNNKIASLRWENDWDLDAGEIVERHWLNEEEVTGTELSDWFQKNAGKAIASAYEGTPVAEYHTLGLTPIDQVKPALLSYVSAAQTSTRVTLHLNGGSGGSALWTNDSGTIQVPTNPTREGYTFGGWFTDPDFTVAWNFNSAVTGELSLYAKWVPVSSTASTVGQNTQAISFNGGLVEVQAYTLHADNGGDVTYVKLRDMAALLDGSAAQFNVDWKNGAIYVERGKPYTTRNGTELQPIAGTDGSYEWNTAPILFDGATTAIEGIVLEGSEGSHTFLKLRDLANAVGFTVDWRVGEGIIIGTE